MWWRGGEGEVRGDYPTLIHLTRFSTLSKGTRALSSAVQLNYFPKYILLVVVKTCALGSSLKSPKYTACLEKYVGKARTFAD